MSSTKVAVGPACSENGGARPPIVGIFILRRRSVNKGENLQGKGGATSTEKAVRMEKREKRHHGSVGCSKNFRQILSRRESRTKIIGLYNWRARKKRVLGGSKKMYRSVSGARRGERDASTQKNHGNMAVANLVGSHGFTSIA